jgi:hypothetical protein
MVPSVASQEIPVIFWNLEFTIVVTSLAPLLCQMNLAHNLTFLFFKINFNIVKKVFE